ncbi:MAG: hypothetical protein VX588_00620 [Verrucomicrobiota bacterium]|nr:hypothetical protein [Verrucomicrobiales bacterium]MEC9035297.1 hypothetical protein [Verrucomicrobiota bacterium]|tara:strand:+ start:574 stop:936 length:363 start_codon:yes stop_codon:yes gene_type:complete
MKTSSIIKGAILLIVLAMIVGYYCHDLSLRNKLLLKNEGSATWNKIELKAGGRYFIVHQLGPGETEKLVFHSHLEDGGTVTGHIGQNIYESELGYFTPNLSVDMTILLNDDGSIDISEDS